MPNLTSRSLFFPLLAASWFAAGAGEALGEEVYTTPETFVANVFDGEPPAPKSLWLRGDLKKAVEAILGHPYPALRLRYWYDGNLSAWVLEEIGKVEYITTGIAVADHGIEQVQVLVYRESRGGEVRYPFFTDQFHGARLEGTELDRPIDGISGATLSVRALKNLSALALRLHAAVRTEHHDVQG